MKNVAIAILATLMFAVSASADTITWGVATVSSDDAAFLTGANVSASGHTFILNLLNYSKSGSFDFGPNEVDLAVSPSISGGNIIGVQISYFGSFAGVGNANFVQTANATITAGNFSSPSFSGFSAVAPTSTLNLSAVFNLHDGDLADIAAITKVQYDLVTVETPETTSFALLASGLALISGFKLYDGKAGKKKLHS